ncbi:SH3 domain-containing protein [candidate division WWE3 bacterium]|jgi:hypothetical protein|nr:SH3 domain-containing protein [candidate division WWE3 bacterium]
MKLSAILIFLVSITHGQSILLKDNLRLTPNGKIIGQLEPGSEITVMEDEGDWVKISVEGYVWKASTSLGIEEAAQLEDLDLIIEDAIIAISGKHDSYNRKLRRELSSPDYSKYSELEFMVWAYMQSIWDRYENKYGTSGAEWRVFSEAARKFKLELSEVERIFQKVDNVVF